MPIYTNYLNETVRHNFITPSSILLTVITKTLPQGYASCLCATLIMQVRQRNLQGDPTETQDWGDLSLSPKLPVLNCFLQWPWFYLKSKSLQTVLCPCLN